MSIKLLQGHRTLEHTDIPVHGRLSSQQPRCLFPAEPDSAHMRGFITSSFISSLNLFQWRIYHWVTSAMSPLNCEKVSHIMAKMQP